MPHGVFLARYSMWSADFMGKPQPSVKKPFDGALRPARNEDFREIMRLENEAFGKDAWPADELDEVLQASLDSPYTTLTLAFSKAASPANDNGVAAGYSMGQMETSTRGVIMSMAVGDDFRGQGLGRILLEDIGERLKKLGAQKIVLQVEDTNKVAINLYESGGFVMDRPLPNYYGKGRHGHLMIKDLKPKS